MFPQQMMSEQRCRRQWEDGSVLGTMAMGLDTFQTLESSECVCSVIYLSSLDIAAMT